MMISLHSNATMTPGIYQRLCGDREPEPGSSAALRGEPGDGA
jgi:hypothetical protein